MVGCGRGSPRRDRDPDQGTRVRVPRLGSRSGHTPPVEHVEVAGHQNAPVMGVGRRAQGGRM